MWHILFYSISALARCLLGFAISAVVSLSVAAIVTHLLRMFVHLLKSLKIGIEFVYKSLNYCGGISGLVFCLAIVVAGCIFLYKYIRPAVNLLSSCTKCKSMPDLQYLDDLPLRDSDEDVLGRKAFEDRVLHLIDNASHGDFAQFIGLWGRWGIGKTSCMNRIEDRSKKRGLWRRPIFIHFNLLQYSGRDDLLAALFDVIADSGWMKFYGVSRVSGALGGRMVVNRLLKAPTIRHWCYDALRFLLYIFCSQEQIQSCLARKLKRIRRRVVVVVDDLERLPQDEVCAVMRMLKSVGNLPYVTYVILASEPHLAASVGSMVSHSGVNDVDAGREYLMKLVPDSVELPDINDKVVLERYLEREIVKFARLYWYKFDLVGTNFYFVRKMVDTVRDVKRLVNAVHSALEEQKIKNDGVGVSVNLEDLVMLQAVRLKWPDFYDALPEMYGFFRDKGHDVVCTDDMKLVPIRDRRAALLFMSEYLRIKRQEMHCGYPARMQMCWEVECPEDYKLYEEYRLASVYCFENYFITQFPRRMVSRLQFVTACECVEAYDVAKLETTMLNVDANGSLPELLFLLERKYGEGALDQNWTVLRALARISDKKLLSSSARYGQAAKAVSVYKDIIRHARAGLISIGETDQSALARLVAEEKDSFVLFAGLISDDYNENFERYAKGEVKEPFRFGKVAELKKLIAIVRDRINEKMYDGAFVNDSWACTALMQINNVAYEFGINEGGLSAYRPEGFDFIPSIEIVVQDDECEERFLNTILSIILSIDAYHGPVRCRIHVMIKAVAAKRASLVGRLQAAWPSLDVAIDEKMPDFSFMWVVFVRSGDIVAKEWFSILAYESFYKSVDVISFNFYTSYFEVMFGNRLGTIDNTTNISLYMQPLIELNRVAACFWNKMYKPNILSGISHLPENYSTNNMTVIKLLLKCKKIAHVDKCLLIRRIDWRDVNEISRSAIVGLNEGSLRAIWNMKALNGTIYAANAFTAMIEALRAPPSFEMLYRPMMNLRLIDDICPKTWLWRRMRIWLCRKMPWISMLLFPRRQKIVLKEVA